MATAYGDVGASTGPIEDARNLGVWLSADRSGCPPAETPDACVVNKLAATVEVTTRPSAYGQVVVTRATPGAPWTP